jgi:probable rRNA maturation factor
MSPRQPPQTPPLTRPDPEPDSGPEIPEEPISVQVDEVYEAIVDPADIGRAVAAALAAEGRLDGELTVVITGDDEVQALNAQYRGLSEPTDVLSFPAQDAAPGFVSAPDAGAYLGDIIIALPFTQRQAAALERNLRDELRLLAIHGTLHLLGYDHAEPEEEAQMWARQDAILAGLMP